jgi:hypothetical protein
MNNIGHDSADTAIPMRSGDPVASNTHIARAKTRIVLPEFEVNLPMNRSR